MSTTKKTAAVKTVRAKSEPLPAITVRDLESALTETLELIEKAEALAPSGIVTQQCQLAKVRARHSLELLEALKP